MNRITSDRTPGEVRFSASNPPSTEEEANEVLEQLEEQLAQVEAQLDHADPDDWASDGEYRDWRRRATGAVGFIRREQKFLQNWLKQKETERKQQEKSKRPSISGLGPRDLAHIAQGIRKRAEVLAEEIGQQYSSMYSPEKLPSGVASAHQRIEELSSVRAKLQVAFTEITAAWTEHPLRRSDIGAAKLPLSRILGAVEAETAALRQYIREQEMLDRSDWKQVCCMALSRAVTEGFKLTEDEISVLNRLREYNGLAPLG